MNRMTSDLADKYNVPEPLAEMVNDAFCETGSQELHALIIKKGGGGYATLGDWMRIAATITEKELDELQ